MNLLILVFLCFISKVFTQNASLNFDGLMCIKNRGVNGSGAFYLFEKKYKQMYRLQYETESIDYLGSGITRFGSATLIPTMFVLTDDVQTYINALANLKTKMYSVVAGNYTGDATFYVEETFETYFDDWESSTSARQFHAFGRADPPRSLSTLTTKTEVPAIVEATHILTPDCRQTVKFIYISNRPSRTNMTVYEFPSEVIHYVGPFNGSERDTRLYIVPRFVIAKTLEMSGTATGLEEDKNSFFIFPDGKWRVGRYGEFKENYKPQTNTYENVERFSFHIRGGPSSDEMWEAEMKSLMDHQC